jgi:hypothetical protein
MRLFLIALLTFCLIGCGTIDRARHDPLGAGEPGIHYKSGTADYESDRVIYMRGAIVETSTGHWLTKRTNWRVDHPERMYVKTNPGEHFTQAQIDALALAPLTQPVFDNAERRMLHGLAWGYGIDLGSSAICLGVGASEGGPIAAAAPVAGLGILALHYAVVRADMKQTPLYYSNANRKHFSDKMVDFNAVEHGAVGVHNLLTCL